MIGNIKLIVGLANPGAEYALTRHNVGARYVEFLAKHYNQLMKKETKFFGYTTKINLANNQLRLLIPTTYMNLSGKSVLAFASFYCINPTEILVAHDELDLIAGVAKIKFGGSNGGHNGLKDIQKKLKNNPDFYRLRIGVGHPGDKSRVAKFLLSKPTIVEQKLIDDTINKAIYCTSILVNEGINKAVNHLHTFKAAN